MASDEYAEIPGAIRTMVKIWGAFSALVCIGFSIFVMITLTARCFIMGTIMIVCGLCVLLLEVPIICSKIDILGKISRWFEDHLRFWMRALLYLSMSLPPIVLCFETSTVLGSGAILVTAAFYGVMAIGKKGQGVQTTAAKSNDTDVELKESLVDSHGDPKDLGSPS